MSEKLEQNQHAKPMSHMARVTSTGFFGGFFWSLIGFMAFYMNFTSVGPALALNPIALGDWKNETLGQLIGIIVIAILSIGVAITYNVVLQKAQKMWVSGAFGLVLWVLIFYVLRPIFPGLKKLSELGTNTIVTTICLYILYGVFIGYSVSYDAKEKQERDGS